LYTIVKMKFGSHLYGTDTPESDTDYKGIYLDSYRDILLGRVSKGRTESTGKNNSKNSKHDVDTEWFSLHQFIKLAMEGQTVAMDMLHAPDSMIEIASPEWTYITDYRALFYTKNLVAFMGYCQKQAAKYGIKGSRLSSISNVLNILSYFPNETTLSDIWDSLLIIDHCNFVIGKNGEEFYQVCGKKFQKTAKVKYVYDILLRFEETYGHRARQTSENKGIDWKALSHAVRVCYQMKELYQDGTITFPLKHANIVKKIKMGELDFISAVQPTLERLISEVKTLAAHSSFPSSSKYNSVFWEDFIVMTVERKRRLL